MPFCYPVTGWLMRDKETSCSQQLAGAATDGLLIGKMVKCPYENDGIEAVWFKALASEEVTYDIRQSSPFCLPRVFVSEASCHFDRSRR